MGEPNRKDKYDWANPPAGYNDVTCPAAGTTGHDSRGWAWALWDYGSSSHGLGFNDYMSTSRSTMNRSIMRGIGGTSKPVGVIAAAGLHAILAVGYQSDIDPFSAGPATLQGFYIWDPWFHRPSSIGISYWPDLGYAENTFVSISLWNADIFRQDHNEGPYYEGNYVAVMRSFSVQSPRDNPAQSMGDYLYDQLNGGTALSQAESEPLELAEPAGAASLDLAIADGLRRYDLIDNPQLGVSLWDWSVGRSVHVDVLASDSVPYTLVELVVGDRVRALALLRETGSGYTLGAIRATDPRFRLPTATELDRSPATECGGQPG